METLLGCIMIYSWVHAIVLQINKKVFKDMSSYEQTITVVAITGALLIIIGLLIQ